MYVSSLVALLGTVILHHHYNVLTYIYAFLIEKEIPIGIVLVFHNLPPNTNHITYHHLELTYQFVLSTWHSPGINLRWLLFNFPSIPSTPPSFCLAPSLVALFQNSHMCSHTSTLFWLRKMSVTFTTLQLSLLCLSVPFIRRSLHFSVRVFSFFSYFLC